MIKNVLKFFIVSLAFLFFPVVSNATVAVDTLPGVECLDNLPPELQVGDPACWTSIPDGFWNTCHWDPYETVCVKPLTFQNYTVGVYVEGILQENVGIAEDIDFENYYNVTGTGHICTPKIYGFLQPNVGISPEAQAIFDEWQAETAEDFGVTSMSEFEDQFEDPCPDGDSESVCLDTHFQNNCGPWSCTNMGIPVDYEEWVETPQYYCHYTTVSEWGLPDASGLMLASAVIQHSTQVEAECVSEPNFKYTNAITDLKIKNINSTEFIEGGVIDVKKSEGIDIEWLSQYATSCIVPGTNTGVNWSGTKDIFGSQLNTNVSAAPKPLSAIDAPTILDYQLTCQNAGGILNTDTINVRVSCEASLDPAWGACDSTCGVDAREHRTLVYENCFTEEQMRECIPARAECPVISDWREVQP